MRYEAKLIFCILSNFSFKYLSKITELFNKGLNTNTGFFGVLSLLSNALFIASDCSVVGLKLFTKSIICKESSYCFSKLSSLGKLKELKRLEPISP